MKTSDFDYFLPPELIAQTPTEPRDQSRLMVINRSDDSLKHHRFSRVVDYLRAGDVLVFNDSRVIPARLSGTKVDTGGMLEILLLRRLTLNIWETLVRPAKRAKAGTRLELTSDATTGNRQKSRALAEVVEVVGEGKRVIKFSDEAILPELGRIPLPPYIHTPLKDPERYQTVYANVAGSAAAPTAGLHFTHELINRIKSKGVQCLFVTLHVGLDTFLPVREDSPLEHPIHREYGVLSQEVANQLSQARVEKRRVVCVGTTTVRLVEAVAQASSPADLQPFEGWVSLFILPGYQFQMVDTLITNFHLPKSTLMMLVTAFAGRDLINKAYQEAIAQKYRFYSFGDAMLIL
ncbi:MAG: tRNA preQ1(34) S-adenosylmethionine ribosyltransferase-isomerase QueA [Dehalococcoidales bacterium]|nr:tRNA preQ1(34) S-adenosylmethionine ribosyltransferase-isomerase QueA [Dehalococcoidales bacterium]